MKILQTTELTEIQTAEIKALVHACKQVIPLTLSFPYEEVASFYLLYDPELVCALALILPLSDNPDDTAECIAFTLPSKQRMGYFTSLFQAAEEEIEDTDLLFLTDNSSDGAARTLESLGAEFDFDEYRMELDFNHAPLTALGGSPERLLFHVVKDETTVSFTFTFSLKTDPSCASIGNCHAIIDENAACLYGFFIEPQFRNMGLGTEAFLLAAAYLQMQHCTSASLHVSGDNAAAVRIYKKAGFRITETLSYYLY